jgi:hypothetical protein
MPRAVTVCRIRSCQVQIENATVLPAFLATFAIPLEQQPVHLHDAVDAFGIGRCAAVLLGLAAQWGINAAIA